MEQISLSRRSVLQGAAATLTLFACADDQSIESESAAAPKRQALGVYISIAEDNSVTFTTPNAEMGQGTYDGLARMMAEELDIDWDDLSIELSGANKAMINPAIFSQTTGNSVAIRGFGPVVRKAGAAARQMLRQAAADRAGVALEDTQTNAGTVIAGGQTYPYGDLVAAAAQLPVPEEVALKRPEEFMLIGKPFKHKETRPKTTGEAVFGIDVDLPNMAVAALAVPEEAWGTVLEPAGLEAVRARDGVAAVTPVSGGYAVIAEDFWTAKTAADSLNVTVEMEEGQRLSSDDMNAIVAQALSSDDAEAALYKPAQEGQNLAQSRAAIRTLLAEAASTKTFDYAVPVLAHGALEPLSATALFNGDSVEVWAPTQNPGSSVRAAAQAAGVAPEQVTLHRTFLGGGFGRKWNTDFVTQAVQAAMALPGRPVKLIWTREQDTQHDFYRPTIHGKMTVALNETGAVTGLSSAIAGQSLSRTWFAGRYNPDAPDNTLQNTPSYGFGTIHVESRPVDLPLPMGWWRSVSHMPTVFFQESLIDELALAADENPFDYRLRHLENPRGRAVLEALRARVEGTTEGAVGISYAEAYDGHLAAAVDLSIVEDQVTLHGITVVADIGLAIDPQTVKRQIAGGIYFGLGPALDGAVQIEAGKILDTNFDSLGALTPAGAPPIEVTLIDNPEAPPAGVGEIGTPLIAPALCNAIVAAGGPRIRTLPVSQSSLSVQV